jgi:ABC-2 type transport system ATP-binding protein
VILTTHELTEAERLADHVVIIDRGRMLASGSPSDLASGMADGSIRFTTAPGIDTGDLARALKADFGGGVEVAEERPGSYRLSPPAEAPVPPVIAALTGWLAGHDLSLGDLRAAGSLEEAYLAITGSRGEDDPSDPRASDSPESPDGPGSSGGRAARTGRSTRNRASSRSRPSGRSGRSGRSGGRGDR